MTIIAMTREMGTLGKDVAMGLVDTLDLDVVHHELVERHIAEKMNLGESSVHRFLEGRPSLLERWKIDAKRLSRYSAEEILELAQKGNVLIRGWGAAQLLSDVQHVICVRICAPMTNRVAEMMQRLGITDEAAARREIERNDDAHTRAIQRQFGQDWRSPYSYDIVLNTGRVPIDACVRQIRLLADCPVYEATEQSRSKLNDKLIEARVRTIVDANWPDMPFGSGLSINVSEGVVTLTGVTAGSKNVSPTIEEIMEIDGVSSVKNEVLVARQGYGV
jgi:cytidylate kinase